MVKPQITSIEQLRKLEPLSSLSTPRLEELLPLTEIKHLVLGQSLFREGDIDNQLVYLLQGDVQLNSQDEKVDLLLSHHVMEARFPLDDSQPHSMSCVALSKVQAIYIDNSVLDYLVMWDQLAVAETLDRPNDSSLLVEPTQLKPEPEMPLAASEPNVPAYSRTDDEDKSGWVRRMRQVMAFKNLPPANIRSLLERMETVSVSAGEVIVKQGQRGDFYYVLTEGEARVTQNVELAKLTGGDSFGEEALLSGVPRNATITMLEDGQLMRLSKKDFDLLLKEPMLKRLSMKEAQQQVSLGACWLDVRYAKEYRHHHLPGSINIPLHELRVRLDELDSTVSYICYCSTGRRSSAAAFLLSQKGFRAGLLGGGIQSMKLAQDAPKQPAYDTV